jgi:hypothetical protein
MDAMSCNDTASSVITFTKSSMLVLHLKRALMQCNQHSNGVASTVIMFSTPLPSTQTATATHWCFIDNTHG